MNLLLLDAKQVRIKTLGIIINNLIHDKDYWQRNYGWKTYPSKTRIPADFKGNKQETDFLNMATFYPVPCSMIVTVLHVPRDT